EADLAHPESIAGTPEYMAPEQAAGGLVDHRADLFALGAVIYAACTGRSPFRATTLQGVLQQVTAAAPPPLRALNPGVPRRLEALVHRLLAKDPAHRYGSAAEVADALRKLLVELQGPPVAAPRLGKMAFFAIILAIVPAFTATVLVLGTTNSPD